MGLDRITRAIAENNVTPADALTEVNSIFEECSKYHNTINALRRQFEELNLEFDGLQEGEFEIGMSLPKSITKGNLEGLEEEVHEAGGGQLEGGGDVEGQGHRDVLDEVPREEGGRCGGGPAHDGDDARGGGPPTALDDPHQVGLPEGDVDHREEGHEPPEEGRHGVARHEGGEDVHGDDGYPGEDGRPYHPEPLGHLQPEDVGEGREEPGRPEQRPDLARADAEPEVEPVGQEVTDERASDDVHGHNARPLHQDRALIHTHLFGFFPFVEFTSCIDCLLDECEKDERNCASQSEDYKDGSI